MLFSNSLLAAATLCLSSALAAPASTATQFCQPRPATDSTQALLWHQFVEAFYVKQNIPESFKYIEPGFIQHNAFSVGQGAASSENQIEQVWPQSNISLLHSTYSNGFGWVHTEVFSGPTFPNKTAILDLYRFEGACIVEHWDSIQVADKAAVNPAFPN